MSGAVLALAVGAHRRFGPAVVVTAAAAAAFPDWDDLPGGVHRIWGHSLLTAPLAGGLIGALGFLCYSSARRQRPAAVESQAGEGRRALAVWVLVGLLASATHLLADLAYSGTFLAAEWPVALLWPISSRGWAYPLVPWADRGLTVVFAATLIGACLVPSCARLLGVLGMLISGAYVVSWATWAALY
jgi:hypothetical protein